MRSDAALVQAVAAALNGLDATCPKEQCGGPDMCEACWEIIARAALAACRAAIYEEAATVCEEAAPRFEPWSPVAAVRECADRLRAAAKGAG